jgi:NADH:ubiquinone oxidoreductase subunit 2 (subunit N)
MSNSILNLIKIESIIKYFLVTALSSILILFSIIFIYIILGTTNFDDFVYKGFNKNVYIYILFFTLGLLIKIGAVLGNF